MNKNNSDSEPPKYSDCTVDEETDVFATVFVPEQKYMDGWAQTGEKGENIEDSKLINDQRGTFGFTETTMSVQESCGHIKLTVYIFYVLLFIEIILGGS